MFLIKTQRVRASLFTLLSVSLLLACFAFLTTSITPAHAVTTVPTTMNFQGRLADSSGNIMPDGLYNMQFRLFTVGSGGSSVWNETRENNGTDYRVQVTNGLFSTKLGEVSPLSASLFASGSLYFEITMATPATATCSTASCASWESPMTPRHELSTSAYAYNAETLDGLDSAAFAQLSSNNTLTGTNTISTTNATAFQVQNASTVSALTADTSNLRVQVGSSTTDATAVFFLLDQYNQATDPTNTINGAMYYNTDSNKFRCYQSGAWTDCIGTGSGGGATTALDNLASTNINAALNATSNNLTLQTTTSGDVNIAPAGVINLQGDAVLASGSTLRIVGDTTASRPASPTEGMIYYDTDIKELLIYANGKWQADRSGSTKIVGTSASGGTSSAIASLNAAGADYVNTSDSSAQTTINNALSAVSSTGGTVYLMEGTYIIDGSISVPNNTTLAGAGAGTIIKFKNGINANFKGIVNSDVTTGTGVIIRDFVIDGNSTNQSGTVAMSGIYMTGMGAGTGSSARDGGNISFISTRNLYSSIGAVYGGAVVLDSSSNNTVTNNTIKGNTYIGTYGVFLKGSAYNDVSDNLIQGNYSAVVLEGSSTNNAINNNTSQNNNQGFQVYSSYYNVFSNNTVWETGSSAFYLYDADDNEISGNYMRSQSYGVTLSVTPQRSRIINNHIEATSGEGISGTGHYSIIKGNRIISSGGSADNNAIRLGSGSADNQIVDNEIIDTTCSSTCYAIDIAGNNNPYLSNNYFHATSGTAIIYDAGASGTVYSNQPLAENGGSITTRTANSTTAFQVQNASGANILTADTTNGEIEIGSASLAGKLAISDGSSNTATITVEALAGNYTVAIPTITGNDTFCLESLGNCGGASSGATTALDNLASTNINAALNATSNNLTLQTTTSGDVNIAPAGVINLQGDAVLASGNTLRIVGDTYTNIEGYSSPTEGQITYDQTNDQLLVYNATLGKWQADKSDAILVAASNSSQTDKNAADYVADGTDDQVQINAALAAADPASGTRKTGKVYLFAGTYTTHQTDNGDATIFIPDNTTLAGAGRGTLIQLGDIDATDNLIENSDTTTGTGVVIQDLRLDGQKSLNTAGIQTGIYLNGVGDNATARQGGRVGTVWVQNFRTTGILLNNSDSNFITNNSVQGSSDTGIATATSNNNTISDNVANNNAYGIIASGSNNTISNNVAKSNINYGVAITAGQYNNITGNVSQLNIYGIYVSSATDNNIVGNTAESNTYSIYLTSTSGNAVSDNQLVNSGSSSNNNAIYLSASDSNTITANSITDTSATTTNYAINIFNSTSDTNYLANNRFSSTPGTSTISDAGTGTIYSNQPLSENGGSITTRTANSTTAFQVQNASGANILTADTTNGEIEIGSASLAGKLAISDGSSNTATITVEALAGNYTVAIPTITGNDTFCLESLANCGGSGATTALDNLASTNINAALNATANDLTLQTTTSGNINLTPAGIVNITGTTTITGTTNLNTTGTANTNIGNGSTGTVTIGNSTTGAVSVQSGSDISLLTNSNSTGVLVQSVTNSATAFEIQNAASNVLFGVDTSASKVLFGTAGSVGGALQINAATSGNVTISIPATTTSYNLILPSAAGSAGQCLLNSSTPGTLTWGSCGGGGGETKTVSLIPEFAGGTLQADGSNNAGVMNADFVSGLSAGEGYKHSYYQWTTSNTSAQDYNIIVNTQLPSDYASGLGNLKIWGYSSSTTLATATIQFADVDGTTCYASPVSFTPSTASTWEQKTVGTMSGCSFSANDIVTVTIVVAAEDDEVVRVGELSFEYTN